MQMPPYKLILMSERLPLWLPLVLIMGGVYASLHFTHHYRMLEAIQPQKAANGVTIPPSPAEKYAAADTHPQPSLLVKSLPAVKEQEKAVTPPTALQDSCKPLVFLIFKRNHLRPNAESFSAKAELIKKWLTQHPGLKLVLEGYSDSVGSKQAKLLYSYRRAKMARSMLVESGIAEDRLIVDAHADIVEPGLDAESSRRVTLKAESASECINQLFDGIKK